MIEDYYGFSSYGNTGGLRSQRSAQRTQRSPRLFQKQVKSPMKRSLKRTQLSKQKLKIIDRKQTKLPPLPQLARQQTSRQDVSYAMGGTYNGYTDQEMSNHRLAYDNVAKKYDNYMRTQSIELTQQRVSSTLIQNHMRKDGSIRRPHHYQNPVEHLNPQYSQDYPEQNYQRQYRSASRNKGLYVSRFHRPQPVGNAIDRAVSRSQTPRNRKAQSLTNTIKKKYIMHTFYPAERKNYYNYNDQGYIDSRQEQLRQRLEDRARRAFQRAVYEDQTERREQRPKRQSKPRRFQVQQPSRIKHQNSGILNDPRLLNDNSRYNSIPVATKRSSERSHHHHEERVVDVSIDPRKQQHYDDYQVRPISKNRHQLQSNPSISQYLQQRSNQSPRKNIIQSPSKEEDDSFLIFKKPQQKKQNSKLPISDAQKNKIQDIYYGRNSQISEHKSIDMMQINSNCKMNQKQLRQRQKMDFNNDDNKSLGINTIRSFREKKQNSQASYVSRQSQSSVSDSVSQSSYSESRSSPQTNKLSKSSIREKSSFQGSSKMKIKSSQSFSQLHHPSVDIKVVQPQPSKASIIQQIPLDMKKKQTIEEPSQISNPISKKQQNSMNQSLQNTSHKKIKRLKKANASSSDSNQSIPKIQSLSVLGVQSFSGNFNNIEHTVQVKVNQQNQPQNIVKPMSRIDQSVQKNISNSNSKVFMKQSQLKSRQSKYTPGPSLNKSNNSVVYRSKLRSSQRQNYSSGIQYDLFQQMRQFLEEQQNEYHIPRQNKQHEDEISQQLQDVITKIQQHLYQLNLLTQIISMIPDIYDFETIYDRQNDWIFLALFLTLKKYMFQRSRCQNALNGGKNCFKLLGNILEDEDLKKYAHNEHIRNIYSNLVICNRKLQSKNKDFYNFLVNFKKLSENELFYNLNSFNNNEQLGILLMEYDKQIDNLKKKRIEQFKDGNIPQDDVTQYDMLMCVNERIFRLMQVGFLLANLAGKQIKAMQKDQELFRDQQRFKDYLVYNQPLFQQLLMIFK